MLGSSDEMVLVKAQYYGRFQVFIDLILERSKFVGKQAFWPEYLLDSTTTLPEGKMYISMVVFWDIKKIQWRV